MEDYASPGYIEPTFTSLCLDRFDERHLWFMIIAKRQTQELAPWLYEVEDQLDFAREPLTNNLCSVEEMQDSPPKLRQDTYRKVSFSVILIYPLILLLP